MLLFAYLFSGQEESPVSRRAVAGMSAPDFTLPDISGKTWRLSDLRGKVVLINFWATWCDSCKEENPSLQRFVSAEKENKNLVVLTILYNDSPENATQYLKNNHFSFNVLIDDRKTSLEYGITGVPETFVLSKSGSLKNKFIGPVNWDDPDVKAAIDKLAAEM
ncbi:MAG TPA: TlpA disulfide reductase family protein [Dissulfurispiraceae bacterium]|nr:TlpA disulfide reductase family protein [Dissulfurispiraceae bacterium]